MPKYDLGRAIWVFGVGLLCLGAGAGVARGQASDPKALSVVRAAVAAELEADRTDKSVWTYRDHDVTPEHDAVYQSVETPQGMLRRLVEIGGKPLSAEAAQDETRKLAKFVSDRNAVAKQRKDSEHDDAQAKEMLQMLPNAFLWSLTSETPEAVKLSYKPNPTFSGPDMQSRVMSTMSGEMVVALPEHRIRTLKGALSDDFKIGFGMLGKLNKGGTFDVERREVAPGLWQITETHVHIGGHALLFKTIGQQQDETKTQWKPSTDKTLEEAARTLGALPGGTPSCCSK